MHGSRLLGRHQVEWVTAITSHITTIHSQQKQITDTLHTPFTALIHLVLLVLLHTMPILQVISLAVTAWVLRLMTRFSKWCRLEVITWVHKNIPTPINIAAHPNSIPIWLVIHILDDVVRPPWTWAAVVIWWPIQSHLVRWWTPWALHCRTQTWQPLSLILTLYRRASVPPAQWADLLTSVSRTCSPVHRTSAKADPCPLMQAVIQNASSICLIVMVSCHQDINLPAVTIYAQI